MSKHPITYLPLESLELDPENPRLPTSINRNQTNMLQYIARETSIEELMAVIGQNGFFDGEALIAYPKSNGKEKYIVIEGNRRLTAILLLHDPDLYPKRKLIREIAENATHKPTELPIAVFDHRSEVLTYLGYRHITGIKPWDPLAKARYMYQLFGLTDESKTPTERYREVASEIGSRRDFIKRSLDALAAYNEIEKESFYNIEDLDETTISFSLLSTALPYPVISEYTGMDNYPILNTEDIRGINVEKLTRWMFEKKSGGETILGESRNIQKLAEVIGDQKSLGVLEDGGSLDQAYRLTAGVRKELIHHLYQAQDALGQANSIVAIVKADEIILETAKDIVRYARNLVRSIEEQLEDL